MEKIKELKEKSHNMSKGTSYYTQRIEELQVTIY